MHRTCRFSPPAATKTLLDFHHGLLDQKSSSPPDTTVTDLVRAWNQGRTNEIAKMFASDGVLVIPAGSQIQSSAEIEKTILERRAGILKDTT
jgi:hypothetical protein